MKIQTFLLFFFYILCVHWPHSYIHTFIHPVMFYGARYHRKQPKVSCVMTKWVIVCPSYSVLWRWSQPLAFCSVWEEKPTGRPISTFMQRWSHTGTKMFSQQWREKTCFCGVTIYLNIISVLHRQTHNVMLRYWENIPLLMLAKLSEVICTGISSWYCLDSERQRGWNTDCYWVSLN